MSFNSLYMIVLFEQKGIPMSFIEFNNVRKDYQMGGVA